MCWARSRLPVMPGENRIPFLGICLGMQSAVIEFARSVCGLEGPTARSLIPRHPPYDRSFAGTGRQREHRRKHEAGQIPVQIGTRKQGLCCLWSGSDRGTHRHRYEFNISYRDQFTAKGMEITGTSSDGERVEVMG